jgi:hypothetical protein
MMTKNMEIGTMMVTGEKETIGGKMHPSATSALHISHGLNQGQQAAG